MAGINGGCPHLGLANDAGTHCIAPDEGHRCYCLGSPRKVTQKQQVEFCLNDKYQTCTVLASSISGEEKRGGFLVWLVAFVVLLSVAVGFAVFGVPFNFLPGTDVSAANVNNSRLVWSSPTVAPASAATVTPALTVIFQPVTPTISTEVVATAVDPTSTRVVSSATKVPTAQPTKTPVAATATSTRNPRAPVASPTPFIYTVVKGDTLRAIADRFGVSVDAIAKANSITDVAKLSVGQKLVIPR